MDLSGKKQRTHAAVFIAWGKSVLHVTLHGRDRAYVCTWISQVSFPLTVWLCAFNVLVMSTTMLSFLSPSSESLVSHLGDLWHRPLKYNRIKGSVSTENKLSSPSSIIPKSDREEEKWKVGLQKLYIIEFAIKLIMCAHVFPTITVQYLLLTLKLACGWDGPVRFRRGFPLRMFSMRILSSSAFCSCSCQWQEKTHVYLY